MNFFVNILWILSYPNYSSKIGFMIQHYVPENFHAPFKFLLPQSRALIMTSPLFIFNYKTVFPFAFCSILEKMLRKYLEILSARNHKKIREQSLSMTGRGAEEIWMGYEIFLRVFVRV